MTLLIMPMSRMHVHSCSGIYVASWVRVAVLLKLVQLMAVHVELWYHETDRSNRVG